MTNRKFYQAVIDANISTEMNNYAQELIDKLDRKNENRKPTKTQQANETYKNDILDNLADGAIHTSKMITDYLNNKYPDLDEPITTQKTSALLTQLVKNGGITVIENFKDSKKNRVKGYQVMRTDNEVEETEEEE
jgi:hypothetical protein